MPLLDRNRLKLKNAGRAQFAAVREEVLALLAEDYSRHALYAELHEKGAFTGSYRRFCEYVQEMETQRGNREPEPAPGTATAKTTPPAAPESPAPQLTPPKPPAPEKPTPQPMQPEKTAAGGFTHVITPNINDLV